MYERSTSMPAVFCPAFAIRWAHRIGSSVMEPLFSRNVHSPSQSSEPQTLIAGTRNRRSISSRTATALSLMFGPITARQPSSTSSPNASITALTVPLGRPSTSRWTSSTGRSIIPDSSPSLKTNSTGWTKSARMSLFGMA